MHAARARVPVHPAPMAYGQHRCPPQHRIDQEMAKLKLFESLATVSANAPVRRDGDWGGEFDSFESKFHIWMVFSDTREADSAKRSLIEATK